MKTKTFNVRLSPDEHTAIAALAHLTNTSMSQVMIDAAREKLEGIRDLPETSYQMIYELCQHHRRTPADMMRLLIEDAHKAMKEKQHDTYIR